jgi:predicted acetyltransferase
VEFEIRAARREEIDDMHRTLGYGFGFDPPVEDTENLAETLELDRTRCAFEGSTLVATSGAFSLDLTVPGGSLATAGTTLIAVRSSHRRRGLLRAMMTAHLEDVRERDEPLAALWASESAIYRRFGYGTATYMCRVEIERAHAAFAKSFEAPGTFRLLERDEACKVLPEVYDQVRRQRPGHFAHSPSWWEHRRTFDPEYLRDGATRYRYALYEESGTPRGYLQYRTKRGNAEASLSDAQLRVIELQGVDRVARTALWRYALDVDLIHTIWAWNQPVDDVLPWLLADPRRLTQQVLDSLWVRVVDVPRALEGRAYSTPGRLVLSIYDSFCPWNQGVYELEAEPGGASCRASAAEPELTLSVEALGAVFLGGNRLQQLAQAGWVEGSAEALRRGDALFSWDPLPWCPEMF